MKKMIVYVLAILQMLLLFGCSENPSVMKPEYGTGKEVEYKPCTEWDTGFESSFLGIGVDLSEYNVYATSACDLVEFSEYESNWRNYGKYLYPSVYMTGEDMDGYGGFLIFIEIGTLEDFKNQLNLPELTGQNTYEQLKNAFIREHAREYSRNMGQILSDNEKTKIGDKLFESYEIDAEFGEFNSSHSECIDLTEYGITRQILSTKGQYVIRIAVEYYRKFKPEETGLSIESKKEYVHEKFDELISKFYLVN